MQNVLIGAAAVLILWLLASNATRRGMHINWWQWLLTVLAMAFTAFTLISVLALLGEFAPKAALVIGGLFGIVAIVWWVLLGRFVFARAK